MTNPESGELSPRELAELVAACPRPLLIGVDVDGTLAPIVPRPEHSELAPDAIDALEMLTNAVGMMVAVVSGRPLSDLRHKFEIPPGVMLLGSHGAEVGDEANERTAVEKLLIEAALRELRPISEALPGSWIEHKPLGIALHVRQADPLESSIVLADLEKRLAESDELTLHRGHMVLEIAVRPTSKTDAFGQLRSRLDPMTTVFVGDDASDEGVFQSLAPHDVAIKVGPGATVAAHRLASPTEVVEFLLALTR